MSEKVARVKSLVDPETVVVVDSAAPDLIETLRRAGVQAVPADKGQGSVAYGINVVQTKLAPDDRGVPSLTVDPCCTNTIREFETYEWASNQHGLKDQPRDRDNHAMDSIRYGITNGEAGRAPAPVVFDRAEAAREAMAGSDDHMWSTWQ